MNKTVSILLIMAGCLLISCTKRPCDATTIRAMNDTLLTSDFECLDMDFLRQKGNPDKDEREVTHYDYRKNYENGIKEISLSGSDKDGYYFYRDINYKEFISIYKSYYPDGRIKMKGYRNNLGFNIGTWYYFDEYGDLEKTTDFEEGFEYTFKQLKERLEKEEGINFDSLKVKSSGSGLRYPELRIVRTTDSPPLWLVEYEDKTNSANGLWGTRIEIYYDRKTGEETERNIIPQNPNPDIVD